MSAHRFDLTTESAYARRRSLAEVTKVRTIDPDDPSPDLTLQVAADLAHNEHPRKQWANYSYEAQATYIYQAQFLIVNILRFK